MEEKKKSFFIAEDGDLDTGKLGVAWVAISVPAFLAFAFVVSYLVKDPSTLFTWSTGIILIANAIISVAFLVE